LKDIQVWSKIFWKG